MTNATSGANDRRSTMDVVSFVATLAANARPRRTFGDAAEIVIEWGSLALVVSRGTPRLARWMWCALPAGPAAWGVA